ncbi:uncharacterized protein RCH25_017586 [Pelodytes ibericus]
MDSQIPVTSPSPTMHAAQQGGIFPNVEEASSEIIDSEDLHNYLDSAMSKSVTKAIQSAMGMMSSNMAQSISSALATHSKAAPTPPPSKGKRALPAAPGKKASCNTHHTMPHASKLIKMGKATPAEDAVVTPRERARYRAKTVRSWKSAKADNDSSQSDSMSEEVLEESEDPDVLISEDEFPVGQTVGQVPPLVPTETSALIDLQGEPLFDPTNLHHPRSAEWFPTDHIAQYIAFRVRNPLDKASHNKLRAECPRPTVPDMACDTPEVDPKIAQFLGKTGWKTKKGLDFSLKVCQDKVLDIMGPCAKIFELVESGLSTDTPVDLPAIKGWIQRVICLIGNANTALAVERRKAILLKIEPKLVNMATNEPGPQAKGMLFGDNFVKELGSFVQTFTAIDKAQSSMKRVFTTKVFGGAGRYRGRLPGRGSRGPFRGSRGPGSSRTSFADSRPPPATFFPQRSRPWQNRGARGSYQSRRPYGKDQANSPFFPYKSRWQAPILSTSLGRHYVRHLGITDGDRLSYRFSDNPLSGFFPSYDSVLPRGQRISFPRGHQPFLERSNQKGSSNLPGLPKQSIPGPQERRRYSPCDQSPSSECLRHVPTFQDGRHSLFKRPTAHGRLDGQAGPSGRVPDSPSHTRSSTVPSIHVGSHNLAVYLSPLRSLFRPLVLHQATQTSYGLAQKERGSSDHIPGRFTHYVSGFCHSEHPSELDHGSPPDLGFLDQPRKINTHAFPHYGVPGVRYQLTPRFITPSNGKGEINQERDKESPFVTSNLPVPSGSNHRSPVRIHSSHFSRPSSLQGATTVEDPFLTTRDDLRSFHPVGLRSQRRTLLVVDPHGSMERESNLRHGSGFSGGIGRKPTRLGRTVRHLIHRWMLVSARKQPAYQLPGASGWRICSTEFRTDVSKLLHTVASGQHRCSPLHQPPGWHEIPGTIPSSYNLLDLLPRTQHIGASGTYSRPIQCGRRLEFPTLHRLQRLAAPPIPIPQIGTSLGSLIYRPLRLSPEHATTTFLQLETRSGGSGDRCVPATVASEQALCVSPILPHIPHTAPPPLQRNITGVGDPLVGYSTMVPHAVGNVHGFSSSPSILERSDHRPPRVSTPAINDRSVTLNSMADIRGPWFVADVSQTTLSLLEGAWAPGTRRAYRHAWGSWANWCMEHHTDPTVATVNVMLQFLTSLFEDGRAYRSINVYRSAISAGHLGFEGVPAGRHILVCRLLKGIRLNRPPRPRYSCLWDVNVVFILFQSWPNNCDLSLQQLSAKLAMLCCLISCKRVSDVRALDISARSFTPEGVSFDISRRTKTSITSVFYPAFPRNPKLCPVLCLKEYELRTLPFRTQSRPELFLALRRTHSPISTTSLARWIKWVLTEAGVDTTVFTPHSTRGAMASKAFTLGCRLEDLLKAADWSRESTFKEFYFRVPEHFTSSVIDQL